MKAGGNQMMKSKDFPMFTNSLKFFIILLNSCSNFINISIVFYVK